MGTSGIIIVIVATLALIGIGVLWWLFDQRR